METIEDIVREMRALAQIDKESSDMIPRKHMSLAFSGYAGRIEAAAKALIADRDNWRNQALAEDERANATTEKSLVVGNMAKAREALRKADIVLSQTSHGYHSPVRQEIKAALNDPARNCDLYSHEEALQIWSELPETNKTRCFDEWLFAEAKGGAK